MSNISMTTSKRNAIVTVMLISAFVSMLNQTILNTALPAIIKGLNITETTSDWCRHPFTIDAVYSIYVISC